MREKVEVDRERKMEREGGDGRMGVGEQDGGRRREEGEEEEKG